MTKIKKTEPPLTVPEQPDAGWGPDLLARFSDLLLHLYQDVSALPESAFMARAFEQLNTLVQFDSGGRALGTGKSVEGVKAFDTYFHAMPENFIKQYNRAPNLDFFTPWVASEPGVTRNICTHEFFPEEVWPFVDHFGFQHMLGTMITDPGTGLSHGAWICRADRGRPFSEQDRLIKQALMPHWAAALTRTKIEPWVRDTLYTPHYQAAAIVDETGELRYAAEGFAAMMQREWPGWRGPGLPEPLRTQVATRVEGQFSGAQLVANINWRGDAHLALVQLRSARVVDQLSAHQLVIARHAASGLGNKEIAKLMGLSPATVRNYLTIIYARLGVKNKLQLPKILAELE